MNIKNKWYNLALLILIFQCLYLYFIRVRFYEYLLLMLMTVLYGAFAVISMTHKERRYNENKT